jgi:hypothetical protein
LFAAYSSTGFGYCVCLPLSVFPLLRLLAAADAAALIAIAYVETLPLCLEFASALAAEHFARQTSPAVPCLVFGSATTTVHCSPTWQVCSPQTWAVAFVSHMLQCVLLPELGADRISYFCMAGSYHCCLSYGLGWGWFY